MEEFKVPPPSKVNYLNVDYGLKSWLLTRDHKRIAFLYLGSISVFFLIGGVYAMLIRLELLTPHGQLLTSTTYNKVFTQHGIIIGAYEGGWTRLAREIWPSSKTIMIEANRSKIPLLQSIGET